MLYILPVWEPVDIEEIRAPSLILLMLLFGVVKLVPAGVTTLLLLQLSRALHQRVPFAGVIKFAVLLRFPFSTVAGTISVGFVRSGELIARSTTISVLSFVAKFLTFCCSVDIQVPRTKIRTLRERASLFSCATGRLRCWERIQFERRGIDTKSYVCNNGQEGNIKSKKYAKD